MNQKALLTGSPMVFWHRETRTEIFESRWTMDFTGIETMSPALFTLHSPNAFLSVIEQHTDVSEHSNTSRLLVLSANWGVKCLLKMNKQCGSLENWNSWKFVQTIMDARVILALEKSKRLDGFSKSHSSMAGPYNAVLSTLQLI